MNMTHAGVILILALESSVASAAPLNLTVRTNPPKILSGSVSVVAIRVSDGTTPAPSQTVKLEIVDGHECGTLATSSSTSSADGTVPVIQFKGADYVESCAATIRVTIPGPASGGAVPVPLATAETKVTVNPSGAANARLDGISAIALVLVVSFAIDRLVRGLFFLLSYWKRWASAFPDPELDDVPRSARVERNRTLVYFLLAGTLGTIALGWFGNVRLLAALGFTAVNPVLDIIVTGVILMGGAERTEQVLKSMGASGSHASAPQSTPLEIRGRLIIDEQGRRVLAPESEGSSVKTASV
jgi:hypothetical protein